MNDDQIAWVKVSVAWIGLLVGGMTLSGIALMLTIIFTALQIYKQVREIRRERRLERLAEQLKERP